LERKKTLRGYPTGGKCERKRKKVERKREKREVKGKITEKIEKN
jgi:hypothetical protein